MTPAHAQSLGNALARVLAADELFFKRRPDRQNRIRRAFPAEIELARYRGIITKPIPDCLRVFVGVRSSGPNSKVIGFLVPGAETDLDEAGTKRMFAKLARYSDETLIKSAARNRAAPSLSNGGVA